MPTKRRTTAVLKRKASRMKDSDVSSSSDCTKVLQSTPKKESQPLRGLKTILTKAEISEAKEDLATKMQYQIDEYDKKVTMYKLSLPKAILNAKLSSFQEYRDEISIDTIEAPPETKGRASRSARKRSRSVSGFKVPAPKTHAKPRMSRSATRSRVSAMTTPYMNNHHFPEMTPITPKFNVNTPVSVLRHPRLGEQAVSLSGSPLHVSIPADVNPSVNVPLSDGKVMTILPHCDLSPNHLPQLDPECRDKLQSIHKYLEQMLGGDNY